MGGGGRGAGEGRLPHPARAELQRLIALDWEKVPDTRAGSLRTAALMDDPPAGGVGALRRLDDRASLLFFVTGQPSNAVNRAAMAEYRKRHPEVPAPAAIPAGATLVPGEVPLTEGLVEGARRCVEWVFGFEFDATQKAEYRRQLVAMWKAGKPAADLRVYEEDAYMATQLALLTPTDAALVRAWIRPKVLERFAASKEADDVWALAQYHARDPLLTPGKPGPTKGDLAAFEELLQFRASEVSGDKAAIDKVVSAAVAKAKAEPAAAANVRGAGLQLAIVKAAWPTLDDADRQELRDRWAADLRPLGLPVRLAAWQSPPAPSAAMAQLDALRKLQQQQQATAAISNMMRMQHETTMTIIRNMGSTPYRYEYRYEYRRR